MHVLCSMSGVQSLWGFPLSIKGKNKIKNYDFFVYDSIYLWDLLIGFFVDQLWSLWYNSTKIKEVKEKLVIIFGLVGFCQLDN